MVAADADPLGTSSDTAALMSIDLRPGSSIGELSRILGKSHSTTVRIIDRLESAGLVRRSASANDARQVELKLTTDGRRRVQRLQRARIAELSLHLEPFELSDRLVLHRLLDALLSTFASDLDGARHLCRFCDHRLCRGAACPVGRPFLSAAGH